MTAVTEAGSGRIVAWNDSIPLHYEYTAGTAGEAFLRALKDGRILASMCPRCGEIRVPPRSYCLECYERTRIDVELFQSGRIAALSTAHVGKEGAGLGARSTRDFGYVRFEGVSGGIIHRILSEGRREARVGDPVTPLFLPRERRTGTILDLEGFRTAVKRRLGND